MTSVCFRLRGPSCADACLNLSGGVSYVSNMVKLLLWCILLVLCWPLALLALVVYPLVWIVLIPFRIVGLSRFS